MASSARANDDDAPTQEIHLVEDPDGGWTARDEATGVVSQGETRAEALDNLDEAVALYRGEIGESIDSPEEERAVLEDLGIDSDEVSEARKANESPPDWMN